MIYFMFEIKIVLHDKQQKASQMGVLLALVL